MALDLLVPLDRREPRVFRDQTDCLETQEQKDLQYVVFDSLAPRLFSFFLVWHKQSAEKACKPGNEVVYISLHLNFTIYCIEQVKLFYITDKIQFFISCWYVIL